MGIRFFCPNGHKLNVKVHLAGKAGFCPECGARLIIPLQSTRKSSRELNEPNEHNKPNEHQTQNESQQSQQNVPDANPVISEIPTQPQSLETSTKHVVKSEKILNPILQDQTVVWYVQVPGGPQYGPVTGQIIHSWIQEQRLEPAMLVWREGWSNWLEAKNVFTELEFQ
ncbi:MAG: DUF4339 domain-containing protein [Planctomycetaceae bacterium]|jgi:uncharacterized Zn finger protein (UPF0148 family)|nr:DUF4339 domain-containing protein [Planctomycetaceae bacterium]